MKKVLILITAVLLLAAVISCNGENAFRQEDAVCSVGSRHFASVQSAVDYVTSTTSRAVSEENTIRLLKDILGTNTPEAQRGSIIIPKDYSGSLLIDLSGHSYEFAGSSFISVNGGKDVTVTNGKLIVPSDNSSTGKVLTVSQGELNIKDVIVDDCRHTPLAADVKKNAKLNISATDDKLSSLNGSFTFSLGASMSVNGGTVTFMTIEEPEVKADISLYKGVIKNSHDVNDRITEAVRNPEIERSIVHTPLAKFNAKAATCTEDGVKEHYLCKTCNGYFLDAECTKPTTASETVISKLGHRDGINEVKAKEPTCTESGNPAYFICTYCQMTFGDGEGKTSAPEKLVIDALGHDLKYVPEKASTCTEQGYDALYGCTRCEHYFSDADANNEIKELTLKPLNPDNHVKTSYTNISDTQHTLKCDDCGKEILTENHNYGDWVANDNETYTLTCKDCDYAITVEHYFEDVKRVESTCTEDGMKEHAVCKLHKGELFSADHSHELTKEEMDALLIKSPGHKYKYEKNETSHWQECTVCGEETPKNNHSYDQIDNNGAEGHIRGCTVCGYSVGTPEAHNITWTINGGQTLELKGSCDAGCGYTVSGKDFIETKHSEKKGYYCTDVSNDTYYTYSGIVDGQQYEVILNGSKDSVLVKAPTYVKGHSDSWNDWVSDEFGHYHECSDCPASSEVLGHTFGVWTIPDQDGVAAERICDVCGFTQKVMDGELVFHDETPSTCTEKGNDPYYSYVVSDGTTIYFNADKTELIKENSWLKDFADHKPEYQPETTPTCQNYGYKEHYECSACGNWFHDEACSQKISFRDEIKTEKTLHAYQLGFDNNQHYEECKYCGVKINVGEHDWVDWTISAPYIAERVCCIKGCNQTTEGAGYEDYAEVSETCTTDGVKAYRSYPAFELELMNDGNDVVTSDLDLVIPAGHQFSETLVPGTLGHYHVCERCSETTEVENHVYGDWEFYNTERHKGFCICGDTTIQLHRYIGDSNICSDCEYEKQ